MTPAVYNYTDPQSYLRDVLAHKQKHNPLFSIRAWARQMGFQCHTSLVFFLNGKRKIRPEHLDRLNRGLRLEGNEENYLRTLVHLHCARTSTDRDHYEGQLKLLHPAKETALISTEQFRLISDWVHSAIVEMTKLKDFTPTTEWITERLKFGVNRLKVEEAMHRLLKLNILEWKDGTLKKTSERFTTPKDRASESIREHHRQVLNNAIRAIEEQDVTERVLNSCTMTVDTSKLAEAQALILKFRSDMAKLMEKDGGDETYQLSVQFFKLTETLKNEGVRGMQ